VRRKNGASAGALGGSIGLFRSCIVAACGPGADVDIGGSHSSDGALAATADAKSVISCRAYDDIQRSASVRSPIALLYLNRVLVDQVHPPRLRQRRERDERRHQRPHSRADRLRHVIGVGRGGTDGYWLCNDDHAK
jgi:hypothetical protein